MGNNKEQRSKAASLVLAILCDELGNRGEALRILQTRAGQPESRVQVIYTENMFAGHLYERLGDIHSAMQALVTAGSNSPSKIRSAEAKLELASANLGLWKRNPLNLMNLWRWSTTTKNLLNLGEDRLNQRILWERGDFLHFIAEYLLIPSTISIRMTNLASSTAKAKLIAGLDFLAIKLFKSIRYECLEAAAYSYISAVRLALKLREDSIPSYTSLSLIRFAEAVAAMGKRNQAQYAIMLYQKGRSFYEWVQSAHGKANAICAAGVLELYKGHFSESRTQFELARKNYGSHYAGILKAEMYAFRAEFWKRAYLGFSDNEGQSTCE